MASDECIGGYCVVVGQAEFACSKHCDTIDDCPAGWECRDWQGATVCDCSKQPETCNGLDDDCNAVVDDANHCGGCGQACGAGTTCDAGQCVPCAASCGPLETCWHDMCVAKLVDVPGFAIDATEVTRAQYAAWLATNPAPEGLPNGCTADGLVPVFDWPPATNLDHPVTWVGWCDAYAYCKGVGKRLCGAIGGGAVVNDDDFFDAAISQWHNACTSGGQNHYPYGDAFSLSGCNGEDLGVGAPVAVGSLAGCASADAWYAGVFDLSGNVREWEDACSDSGSSCHVRGGCFSDTSTDLACADFARPSADNHDQFTGFRCCAD